VLVRALQIQVHGDGPLRVLGAHAVPTAPGLKPHVEDILLLAKPVQIQSVWRAEVVPQDLAGGVAEPAVGAVLGDVACDRQDRLAGQQDPVVRTDEHGDGEAPTPLAAEAPVGPGLQHPLDPLLAPCGNPADLGDVLQGQLPQGLAEARDLPVHADEPLLRCAEDDRALAPPTVGVAVDDLTLGEEPARLVQTGLDDLIDLQDVAPPEPIGHGVVVAAVVPNR